MRSFRPIAFIVIGIALLLAIAVIVYKRSVYQNQSEEQQSASKDGPLVNTAVAKLGASGRELSIVGEARPFAEVTLYAKVSGYLRDISVDKGDHVKKGQVLARIESPETDRSYVGASADARNKRAIAERMKTLKAKDLISAQDAEQADADARVSEAQRDSTGVIKSYEELRAPFDGVITARFADPGALVQSATSSQTSALPLVRVSDVSRLRVLIFLDQKDASFVKIGDPVEIRVDERPSSVIKAAVTRVTQELEQNTRMLLTEIDVANKENALVSGSFVRVTLKTHMMPLVEIPAEALVFQQRKNQVAVIENNTLHYRDVVVHANDGRVVQIASGLKDGEIVAMSVGSTLNDNSRVRPLPPKK